MQYKATMRDHVMGAGLIKMEDSLEATDINDACQKFEQKWNRKIASIKITGNTAEGVMLGSEPPQSWMPITPLRVTISPKDE